jgi:hypothetical protein
MPYKQGFLAHSAPRPVVPVAEVPSDNIKLHMRSVEGPIFTNSVADSSVAINWRGARWRWRTGLRTTLDGQGHYSRYEADNVGFPSRVIYRARSQKKGRSISRGNWTFGALQITCRSSWRPIPWLGFTS